MYTNGHIFLWRFHVSFTATRPSILFCKYAKLDTSVKIFFFQINIKKKNKNTFKLLLVMLQSSVHVITNFSLPSLFLFSLSSWAAPAALDGAAAQPQQDCCLWRLLDLKCLTVLLNIEVTKHVTEVCCPGPLGFHVVSLVGFFKLVLT